MSASQIYIDLQNSLIKPKERVTFITKFVFLNSIANMFIVYFCSHALNLLRMENNFLPFVFGSLILVFIVSLFLGVCNGILQWLFLKKYFGREWIIAIAISGVFFGVSTLAAHLLSFDTLASFTKNNGDSIWALTLNIIIYFTPFILIILNVGLLLAQGSMQKIGFKNEIKEKRWSTFFPLIASLFLSFKYLPIALLLWFIFKNKVNTTKQIIFCLVGVKLIDLISFFPVLINWDERFKLIAYGGLEIPSFLATAGLNVLSHSILTNTDFDFNLYRIQSSTFAFSIIQGLAICLLHRQHPRQFSNLDEASIFVSTSDINSLGKIRFSINKVASRINHLWSQDFNYPYKLTYWLAVLGNGNIAFFHPINKVSQDNFVRSPLNLLEENQLHSSDLVRDPTTKLEVTFSPPGRMKIDSLLGISFSLLIFYIYILSVLTSFVLTFIFQKVL